jgi:mono/diheme cytochrome c family protein
MTKSIRIPVSFALAMLLMTGIAERGTAEPSTRAGAPLVYFANQGWSTAERDIFYTTSQGSVMMPYAWFKALRRLDIEAPFGGHQLQRYGYLPNDRSKSNPEGLPVGFVINGTPTSGSLGMTCAACHTSQIEYEKGGITHALRIDGAPTHADFQLFLTELVAAARATQMNPEYFDRFARAVLGGSYNKARAAKLRTDYSSWIKGFGDFMDASLPASPPWGPGRLDAFGMIFNRVAARDLGIKENFAVADAPVSYPFLWNAPRQDRTQWNGGVPNGLFIHALGRNSGEVLGVFADFRPVRRGTSIGPLPLISFRDNSVSFQGLQTLEELIAKLQPPQWPRDVFGFDEGLAKQGEALFNEHCSSCHNETPSKEVIGAWATPVRAVGTDPKMIENSERLVDSGIFQGSLVPPPPIGARLESRAKAHDVLAVAVVGMLIERAAIDAFPTSRFQKSGVWRALRKDIEKAFGQTIDPSRIQEVHEFIRANLRNMFRRPITADTGAAYEARSLQGIWATAPYLHNGSVPNLWELLTPAKDRKTSFMVGSRVFDPKNVGFVTDQSPFKNGTFTTDPLSSNGNGNGGHEYGSSLSGGERWAIIEYLKGI